MSCSDYLSIWLDEMRLELWDGTTGNIHYAVSTSVVPLFTK